MKSFSSLFLDSLYVLGTEIGESKKVFLECTGKDKGKNQTFTIIYMVSTIFEVPGE